MANPENIDREKIDEIDFIEGSWNGSLSEGNIKAICERLEYMFERRRVTLKVSQNNPDYPHYDYTHVGVARISLEDSNLRIDVADSQTRLEYFDPKKIDRFSPTSGYATTHVSISSWTTVTFSGTLHVPATMESRGKPVPYNWCIQMTLTATERPSDYPTRQRPLRQQSEEETTPYRSDVLNQHQERILIADQAIAFTHSLVSKFIGDIVSDLNRAGHPAKISHGYNEQLRYVEFARQKHDSKKDSKQFIPEFLLSLQSRFQLLYTSETIEHGNPADINWSGRLPYTESIKKYLSLNIKFPSLRFSFSFIPLCDTKNMPVGVAFVQDASERISRGTHIMTLDPQSKPEQLREYFLKEIISKALNSK